MDTSPPRIAVRRRPMDLDPMVGLVIPVKVLPQAKTRLWRGPLGDRIVGAARHELVLAMAIDTVLAAISADAVATVLVVTADQDVRAVLGGVGVPCLDERVANGLNTALRMGARALREDLPHLSIGALGADLPALRGDELTAAIRASYGRRAFCADRVGDGTTLLLSGRGECLRPLFGAGSAAAHAATGARPLRGNWPSLRSDVDTAADLGAAISLGVGPRTADALRRVRLAVPISRSA